MGAQVSVDGKIAVFEGVRGAGRRAGQGDRPARRRGHDHRRAHRPGETQIEDIDHIERGYEDVVEKFRSLGADIRRVHVPDQTVRPRLCDDKQEFYKAIASQR